MHFWDRAAASPSELLAEYIVVSMLLGGEGAFAFFQAVVLAPIGRRAYQYVARNERIRRGLLSDTHGTVQEYVFKRVLQYVKTLCTK